MLGGKGRRRTYLYRLNILGRVTIHSKHRGGKGAERKRWVKMSGNTEERADGYRTNEAKRKLLISKTEPG